MIARLWYVPGSRTVSADTVRKRLTGNLGCTACLVEDDGNAIPAVRVETPVSLLIHIRNHDSIPAQAVELSDKLQDALGPNPAVTKLRDCTRFLEITGTPEDNRPSDSINGILIGLTSGLDGVLEDRIGNRVLLAPRKKASLLGRLFSR